MDTKRLVIVMVVAMAAVLGWQLFVEYLYERNPHWQRPNEQVAATQPVTQPVTPTPGQAVGVGAAVPSTSTTAPTDLAPTAPQPGTAAVADPAYRAVAATQPSAPVRLGVGDGKLFPLAITVNPIGAGIDLATLKLFKDRDGSGEYQFQTPYARDPSGTRPLATRSITVNGVGPIDLASIPWRLESATGRVATFVADITGPGGPVVRVRKVFEVFDATSPGGGYTVAVRQTFENLSDQPLTIRTALNGPTLPPRELERGPDQQVIAGYEDDRQVRVVHHLVEEFQGEDATQDLTKSDKDQPLLWAGTSTTYFQAIVRPEPLDQTSVLPKQIARVEARALDPDAAEPAARDVMLTFETTDLPLAAGQSLTLENSLFLGPKSRSLLNSTYYEAYPRAYDETLVYATGPCAVCTFGWLIDVLVRLLAVFWFIFRDWGLAIIALVVLVRLLLHPLTKRSQINMAKMGKMGPEIERLKKKYGDNKEELNRAMMGVYKEQGATPVWGCLPMIVQMPIWIALWQALNTTFELRQAPLLYGLTWIDDLARPDRLISFPAIHIPFFFGPITFDAINILPIMLGVVFWLQMKFQPKPPTMTPEQEQQQKMMQWMMPFLFPLFTYSAPSGLNLYILTSTGIGIIESKRIRDHIRERDEAEKAGKVIVDAKPTRGMKRKKDDEEGGPKARRTGPGGGPTPPKKGGLGGWLADLQAKAQELAKEAQKKQR